MLKNHASLNLLLLHCLTFNQLSIHCRWVQEFPFILPLTDKLKRCAHTTNPAVRCTHVAEMEEFIVVTGQARSFQQTDKKQSMNGSKNYNLKCFKF